MTVKLLYFTADGTFRGEAVYESDKTNAADVWAEVAEQQKGVGELPELPDQWPTFPIVQVIVDGGEPHLCVDFSGLGNA